MSLTPTFQRLTARQIRRQMLAQRIDGGVDAVPSGPSITPIVIRASSFGGFPTGPVAMPAFDPASTAAIYAFGD
jgi:hypothetical protein